MMGKSSVMSRRAVAVIPFAAVMLTACEEGPEQAEQMAQPPAAQAGVTVSRDLFLASAMAALPPASVTPADLPDPESQGAQVLQTYCVGCHALPSPAMHSATDWPIVLRRMWLRMDRVAGDFDMEVPTTAERAVLLPYLVDNALKVEQTRLPSGPGRDEFTATCSRCHALPDPMQHSATDWVAVGRRMRQHAEDMLGETISPDDFAQIVLYLEQVSGT